MALVLHAFPIRILLQSLGPPLLLEISPVELLLHELPTQILLQSQHPGPPLQCHHHRVADLLLAHHSWQPIATLVCSHPWSPVVR